MHDQPPSPDLEPQRPDLAEIERLIPTLTSVEFKQLKRYLAVNHRGIDLRKAAPKQ